MSPPSTTRFEFAQSLFQDDGRLDLSESHYRYVTVTLPLHYRRQARPERVCRYRYVTDTLPLHYRRQARPERVYRYIAVTLSSPSPLPLHYRCRLDLSEFIALELLRLGKVEMETLNSIKSEFNRMDKNGDGKLTAREVLAMKGAAPTKSKA